ncbi:S-ribosylhomocysteine lyase [Acetobacterium sp.]|jgi:S-ribosylhomocysteine lyase|uniref:S-ribosylhomocysteine lyase n=1 Tax=Acetobacterium sp. TaxID=1872094 RepID=UPI0027179763|nr:S-ribosylhomocysteine lyase [Acetobacterium sp.]MDO9493147.1 S-ribosylhomocysteine lyase [Acetobacterium sp.]
MKKIASFTINHLDLLRGVYISRKDYCGGYCITTFDIRMKEPNREPVINNGELHAMEHLGATFLRNDPVLSDEIVYFGPMGCRTGFYLLMKGERTPADIMPLVIKLFTFMADYDDEIPGASPRDCGNYLDMNLPMARYEANKYLTEILTNIQPENMIYPE